MLICENCGMEEAKKPCESCNSNNVLEVRCPKCLKDDEIVTVNKKRVWCPNCDYVFFVEEGQYESSNN